MLQRTIIQIIALSIALLVVTDYLEQSWLFQRLLNNNNNNDNGPHRVLMTDRRDSSRSLQTYTEDQQHYVCGNNEIRNSHLELGSTGYWQNINSDLAVVTPGYGSINEHALKASNRGDLWFAGMYQTMNASCFAVGDLLEISYMVKLNGATIECSDAASDDTLSGMIQMYCPMVILGSNNLDTSYHHERIYDADLPNKWTSSSAGQWNSFHTYYKLTEENIGATVQDIYIMLLGGQGDLVVDNVNIRLVPCYGNVLASLNGNAEEGGPMSSSTSPWNQIGYVEKYFTVSDYEPYEGQYSFLHYNRTNVERHHETALIGQTITLDSIDLETCLTVGSTWRISAHFRLWDPATNKSSFDNCQSESEFTWNFGNCPSILYSIYGGDSTTGFGHQHYLHDSQMLANWDPYGWNTFSVVVTMDDTMAGRQGFYGPRLSVLAGTSYDDFYVDDVQMERLDAEETPTASPSTSTPPTPMPTTYCTQNWGNYNNFDYTFDDESILWSSVNEEHNVVGPWGAFGAKFGVETPGYGNVGHAVKAYGRTSWSNGPFFYWTDVESCVQPQPTATWRAQAMVRLYYEDTGLPVTTCTPSTKSFDCPMVRILLQYNNPTRSDWLYLHDTTMQWPMDGSYTLMSIDFNIPEEKMADDLHKFAPIFVGGPAGSVLVLDNMIFQQLPGEFTPTATPTQTLAPSPSPSVYCTKNMIRNGDFSEGTDQWWIWNSVLSSVSPGADGELDSALRATNRSIVHSGMSQRIDPSCIEDGSSYLIGFDVKMTHDDTGLPVTTCDPTVALSQECPFVHMLYTARDEPMRSRSLYDTQMVWKSDAGNNSWNRFHVLWKPDSVAFTDLTYLQLAFVGGQPNTSMTIDNVQFEKLERWETPTASPSQSPYPSVGPTEYCDRQHFVNPDADEAGNSGPWFGWGNDVGVEVDAGNNNLALKAYNRQSWHRGIGQWIDPTCVTTNSTWHLQAKVRMYDQATGEPIKTTHCNPKNVLSNWCPMVRLVTSKPKQVVNNETATDAATATRRKRRLAGDDEVESEFLFETFRDTTQVWNDDGSYVELNVYLLLNEGNSGSDLNSFLPYIAGGPPDSVLVVDDVSLYRTSGGDQYSESLPPPKTCSSVGDPHLESHYGILYDNHQSGWTALFDAEGIKIETEQVFLSGSTNVMFNRGWRVTENGIITAQGDNGAVPAEGIFFVMEPITVWIHAMAFDLTLRAPFYDWMYNIFVTTSQFETDDSLCSCQTFEDDESPIQATDPNPEDAAAAEEACKHLLPDFPSLYKGCFNDVLILGAEMMTEIVNMYDDVVPLRTNIDNATAAVDMPEDGSTMEEEIALAEQIKASTDPLTVDANTMRSAGLEPLPTSSADAGGVEGDPVIIGLQQQTFDFQGTTDTWYANFASSKLEWNVKFHHFDSCVGEDSMYITSMAYNIQRTSLLPAAAPDAFDSAIHSEDPLQTPQHQVLVSIADESQVFPGCDNTNGENNHNICLSDGSLQIHIDGEIWTAPGDYQISEDLRIIAFNTWDACARKWYDYEEGSQKHDGLYNNAAVHRRHLRRLMETSYDTSDSNNNNNNAQKKKTWSLLRDLKERRRPRHRSLVSMTQTPLDIIKQDREHMLRPTECSRWLETRTKQDDLFTQTGGWAMVYIVTPHARFQLQHRQVRKTREELEGGGSGGPEDIVVEGMLFESNRHLCQAHVLDGWLAQTSSSLRDESDSWDGILGETQVLKYHDNGEPILANRDLILVGGDADYEVSDPFDTEFTAKQMRSLIRKLGQGET